MSIMNYRSLNAMSKNLKDLQERFIRAMEGLVDTCREIKHLNYIANLKPYSREHIEMFCENKERKEELLKNYKIIPRHNWKPLPEDYGANNNRII